MLEGRHVSETCNDTFSISYPELHAKYWSQLQMLLKKMLAILLSSTANKSPSQPSLSSGKLGDGGKIRELYKMSLKVLLTAVPPSSAYSSRQLRVAANQFQIGLHLRWLHDSFFRHAYSLPFVVCRPSSCSLRRSYSLSSSARSSLTKGCQNPNFTTLSQTLTTLISSHPLSSLNLALPPSPFFTSSPSLPHRRSVSPSSSAPPILCVHAGPDGLHRSLSSAPSSQQLKYLTGSVLEKEGNNDLEDIAGKVPLRKKVVTTVEAM
ncbi:hypothetical protein PIB30_074990 [Stylosanthes scabra]|uniref:Uncharacterized protein n=1 Tax=Stylosanthes scabra TaxID=79078 RepID=A0ABU6QPZ5_9FABA|nr:hypothetical protein [Stylosanthes scabra]